MPPEVPAVRMNWVDLLFLHWRVDQALMRALVPEPLELDLFDGSAWIGLVPFRMEQSKFRGFPPLPGLANFYECNVRTYVRCRGKVGVWFFSLDAQTLLPVLGGRWLWNLNYVYSRFRVSGAGGAFDYRLARRPGPWPDGRTHVSWRVGEPLPTARPGSLEHFLTERYWLFTRRRSGGRSKILAGEVRHTPWALRRAELVHLNDTLITAAGVEVSGPPMLLASDRLEVQGFPLQEA